MNNQDVANLLNRAANALESPDQINATDRATLIAALLAAVQELAIPDMDRDESEDDDSGEA